MTERDSPDHSDIVPHLWLGGFVPGNVPEERFKENVLSYASRNDLTVVLSRWNTSEEDAQRLDTELRELRDRGLDVWLGTYDLRDYTDRELATDDAKLSKDTDRLLRMVDVYTDHYPDGTVFTWHEPPNTGQWTGETYQAKAQSMVEYGPDIFAAQKTAVAERYPGLDFGLMLWWHIVPPAEYSHAPIVKPLMTQLGERDAIPDFIYFDFYRGYYEWAGGYEGVNDVIRASIENVKNHTNDRPVYYLGECHSVNNRYTPSKQSIVGDLRTALDAGADSYGWYIRKSYRETHSRNYNPFLSNRGSGEYQDRFNTMVGSRDRFHWSFQALFEQVRDIDPSDRFDLWIHGHDTNFYEHGVELRNQDGDWEYLGDVSGYLDGSIRYSADGRDRVTAFHGLDRERFLDEDLAVRIESYEGGDGATLHGVYAVPHLDAAHFLPEPELTDLVKKQSDIAEYALGVTTPGTTLTPGAETRIDVSVEEPTVDIRELARPDQHEAFDTLAELETQAEFDPSARFDLWVSGSDLDKVTARLSDTPIEDYATSSDLEGTSAARVYRGLERERFFNRHTGGHYLELDVKANEPATLEAAFVMPYHGTVNFTPDSEAARVIEGDYGIGEGEGQLTTFSLGHQFWPGGATLDTGERLKTWLQVFPKQLKLAME